VEGTPTTPAVLSVEPPSFLEGIRTALDRTSGAPTPQAPIPVGRVDGNAGGTGEAPPAVRAEGTSEVLAFSMVSSATSVSIPPASTTPSTSAPERLAPAAPATVSSYYDGDSSDCDSESESEPILPDDTEARSGVFTAEQWDKMHAHLVAHAVTAQTEAGYQRSLKLWHQFLASLPEGQRPGSLLLAVTSSRDKALFVVLYSVYLYDEHELRDEALFAHLSSLRYHLEVNLQSTTFLSEGVVKRARKAAGFSTEEAKAALVRRARTAILPLILPMANWVQEHYWDGRGWETKADLDHRVIHLAIHLSLDCGNRVSNVTAPDGKKAEDHGIKAGSVVAIIKEFADSPEQRIAGGPVLYEHLLLHRANPLPGSVREFPTRFPQVTGFELTHLTSKTTRGSKITTPKPVMLLRRSQQESCLVDQLCDWFAHSSKLASEDHLLCRYDPEAQGRARQPRRKEIVTAIKACATDMGLNPARFSSKSLRVGFATYANANGQAKDARNYRAGWSAGSTVPDAYYAKNTDGGGVLAWEGSVEQVGGRFGVQHLHNLSAGTLGAASAPTVTKPPATRAKPAAVRVERTPRGKPPAKTGKGAARKGTTRKGSVPPQVAAAPLVVITARGRSSKKAAPFDPSG
jgi:hypothetical protein